MGGGGSTAKSQTEVLNMAHYGVSQKSESTINSSCSSTAKQTNIVSIVGSRVKNLRTSQKNVAENMCKLQAMVDDQKNADLTQDTLTKISKDIEAKGGLPGSGSSSESVTKVYNQMSANIEQSKINKITKDCISNMDQQNIIQIIGSSVSDSDLNQINDSFMECISSSSEVSNMGATAAQKTDTQEDTKVKAKGMDFNDLFGSVPSFASLASLGAAAPFVVSFVPFSVCLCCLICIIIISSMSGMGGGGGNTVVYKRSNDF